MTTAKQGSKGFWGRIAAIATVVGGVAVFLGNVGSIRTSVLDLIRPGAKQAEVNVISEDFVPAAIVEPESAAIPATTADPEPANAESTVNLVGTGLPTSDTVDVTLLNVTGTTAVVTEATLNVRDVVRVSFVRYAQAIVRRSATYDFYTPPQPAPYSISHPLSHDVKPNEADRIGFHLVGDRQDYFIIFDLTLKHSGHNSPTQGKPMMHYFKGFGMGVPTRADYEAALAVPAPVPGQLQNFGAQQAARVRQAFLSNENALRRLEASGATPSSQALEQLNILRSAHNR